MSWVGSGHETSSIPGPHLGSQVASFPVPLREFRTASDEPARAFTVISHKKQAKVEGSTDGPCALFEPEPELRAELSGMPEALVKPDASCIVTLVISGELQF